MNKKYCEYDNCMMQNHKHYHKDEHTITLTKQELSEKVNFLSISVAFEDNKTYLGLSCNYGVFCCEVVRQLNPFTLVEISNYDLERFRTFLNEMKNYEDSKNEIQI